MAQARYYSSTTMRTATTADPGTAGTTLTVTDTTSFASLDGKYPYTLLINWGASDQEIVNVTARPSSTTFTIQRGQDGTTGQAHAASATVDHGVSARDFTQFSSYIANAFVNVKDFGATGDGSTNDYVAIQAAIDLASSTNPGSTVYFPPGTYIVNSGGTNTYGLELKGSCTVYIDRGATIKRGSSSMQYVIQNFNASYAPTLYGGRGNILITGGGTVDGNAAAFSTSVTNIIFAHADNVRVENITTQNFVDWHGIEFNSTKNGVARDVTIQGHRLVSSGREITEAIQIDLAINSAALPGIGAGAYDNTPCNDILIEGCTVRASSLYGAPGCLTGSHSWADGSQHQNIRIIGNYAEGLSNYMCDLSNYSNVTVAGNTCYSSNGFLRINVPSGMTSDMTGFTVANNIVRSSGVKNQAPSVLANAVAVTGQDALTAGSFVNDVAFTGNVFETNANSATDLMLFFNVLDLNYQGGSINNITANIPAMHLTGCRTGRVAGVKLRTITGRGIVVDQGTNATSIGVNIDGVVIEGINDYGIDTVSWAVSVKNCTLVSQNTSGKALLKISGGSTDNQVVNNLIWRRDGNSGANGIEISTSGSAGNKNQLLVGNIVKGFATNTSTAASAVTGTGVWNISGNVTLNPTLANLFATPTSGAPNNYYTATN